MNDEIFAELRFFAVSFYWGMLLLVIYDLFRILRRVIKHNNFFIALEDIIYWTVCGVLIFHMIYRQNNGIIRGFSILAMVLGMLFYHGVFSDFLVDSIAGFINRILAFAVKTLRWILKPFYILLRKAGRLFRWFGKKIRNKYHTLFKALKNKKKSSKIELSENGKGD
jgi:Spore cortex protein YabQ (Spore_YabQ).